MTHVSSTHFVPGVQVGLYGIHKRPQTPDHLEPLDLATVPDGGLVSFATDLAPGQPVWLGGVSPDGRWRVVQAFAKAGPPADPRESLVHTRPQDPVDLDERRIRGARGTLHQRGRKK